MVNLVALFLNVQSNSLPQKLPKCLRLIFLNQERQSARFKHFIFFELPREIVLRLS